MTMWYPLEKVAAYGEDPARPSDFIYHIPEYDDEGNLVAGNPSYWRDGPGGDQPPSRGSNSAQGTHGVGTSIKGDIDAAGPAEFLNHEPSWDSSSSWGPENAGELDAMDAPVGAPPGYPALPAEQLKKDTHFALGPDRAFQWPGGREEAERGHNIIGSKGFSLENSGTDEEPIPSYRHDRSGVRIEPSGDEDAPWQLSSHHRDPESGEAYGTTLHSSAAGAAMAHQSQLDAIDSARPSYSPARDYPSSPPSSYNYEQQRGGRGSGRGRSNNPPGFRRRNIYDAINHATGTASYRTGPSASWDLLNKGTTFGGDPAHLPGHGTGVMNNWVAQQYDSDKAAGKIKHVIYHHRTPLAWLKSEPGEDGQERRTWVIPDERYSQTSSKRQSAIRSGVRGDAVEEPYDPDRGFPKSHHQGQHPDATHGGYMSRSHHAQDTVGTLAEQGFHRPSYNSRQTPVFIRPTTETDHDNGYYVRRTTHGVYMRPVDGPSGPAWVVGEHQDGTNKVMGSKRLGSLPEALAHADRMHQWIRGGTQGQPPAIADRSDSAYRRDLRRRRGLDAPIPRTPAVVMPGQEELPFHTSSVHNWSDLLRSDEEYEAV
jgi:hypothetical protein